MCGRMDVKMSVDIGHGVHFVRLCVIVLGGVRPWYYGRGYTGGIFTNLDSLDRSGSMKVDHCLAKPIRCDRANRSIGLWRSSVHF